MHLSELFICSGLYCGFLCSNNATIIDKFENTQKKCLEWVLFKEALSYSCKNECVRKCKHVKILPMTKRFILNNVSLFHKIVNNLYQYGCLITYHCLMV